MTAKMKAFLASHNITSHSVAAAWLALSGLYFSNAQFSAFVNDLWTMVPAGAHKAILAAVPVISLYYQSTKKVSDPAPPAQK